MSSNRHDRIADVLVRFRAGEIGIVTAVREIDRIDTAEDPRVIAAAALVRAGLAEGTGPERLTIRGVGGWLRERGHSIDNSRVRDVITAVQAES